MKADSKKISYITIAGICIFFSVFLISGFISPAFASTVTCSPLPCIVFDYQADPDPPNGYFVGHEAIINITDAGAVSAGITDITAHIISSSASPPNNDLTFPLHYTPDTANPNTFVSVLINFTTNTFDSTKYILPVAAGGTVRVTYTNATDQTANIFDPNPDPVPTSWGAQPNVTTKPSCSTAGGDTDGDSLCDNWEDQGLLGGKLVITYNTATFKYYCSRDNQTVTNPTMPLGTLANPDTVCPDKDHKDIFVEVDWMKHHKPHPQTIAALIQAFKNAPVGPSGVTCPGDSRCGINLHLQLDNYTIHRDYTSAPTNGANSISRTDFDKIKMKYFGLSSEQGKADLLTAKRFAFHYALFTHFQTNAKGSSGKSEQPGNDFAVSLGAYTGSRGSPDQQEGTFMHELGHNLNLRHGGNEDLNCKPNYLSVMSYSRQFSDLISDRALNYSSGWVNNIDETTQLSDTQSLLPAGKQSNQKIVYGPSPNPPMVSPLTGNFDYDRDNDPNTPAPANTITHNLGISGCTDTTSSLLHDYDDWNHLTYDMKTTSSWADGANRQGVIISADEPDVAVIKKKYSIQPLVTGQEIKINPDEILTKAYELNKTSTFWYSEKPTEFWIPIPPDNYTTHTDIAIESTRQLRSLAIQSVIDDVKLVSTFSDAGAKTAVLQQLNEANTAIKKDSLYKAIDYLQEAEKTAQKSIANGKERKDIVSKIQDREVSLRKAT